MCKSPGTIGFYRRFLWSGWNTNDCSTYDKSKSTEYPAGNLSKAIGSTTLESTLEKANLKMPGWNDNDEEGKKLWKYASMRYAQCASDYIVFFKGKCVREDNVFVTIEFPTIRAGAGVNCIFQVTSADRRNPTTYWVRNGHEDDCKGALADLDCELGQISDAEMAEIPN